MSVKRGANEDRVRRCRKVDQQSKAPGAEVLCRYRIVVPVQKLAPTQKIALAQMIAPALKIAQIQKCTLAQELPY